MLIVISEAAFCLSCSEVARTSDMVLVVVVDEDKGKVLALASPF